ncbi:MAG: hypothetical protein V4556_10465 [Bacteroidota bacterium]
MQSSILLSKGFIKYLTKFILVFCILYYGTIAFIGITSAGGDYYWEFADKYLNYVSWLRYMLMNSSKFFLSLIGFHTNIVNDVWLYSNNGSGVHIGYDCIGYGVIFFWVSFIIANPAPFKRKLKWIIGGIIVIWIINVLRVSLLLLAIHNNWKVFFSINNHTAFNIVAYSAIFTMIYFYDRSEKKRLAINNNE